jgi:predicted ATPase
MPWFLLNVARAYAELGQFGGAQHSIREAMTVVQTTKERWCEAEVNRVAGEIALLSPERDAAKAEGYFERALAVARAQQAKSWELCAATSMGGSGVIGANDTRPAIFSLRSTVGSPKASTRSI